MKIQSNLLTAAFAFGFATLITATASAQGQPESTSVYYSGTISLARAASANYTYEGNVTTGSLHALNVSVVSRAQGNKRSSETSNSSSYSSGVATARIVNKDILTEEEAPKGAALGVFIPNGEAAVAVYSTKNGSTTTVTPLSSVTITVGEEGPIVSSSGNFRTDKDGLVNGNAASSVIQPLTLEVSGVTLTGAVTLNDSTTIKKDIGTSAVGGSASVSGFDL